MANDKITTFNVHGKTYKARYVHHKNFGGEVPIGQNELGDALFDENGEPRFSGATNLDNRIYAYCDISHIENDTDEEFEDYINKWYD